MNCKFRLATENDGEVLVRINDLGYYDDFIKYGECPGYHISVDQMKESILKSDTEKFIISVDGIDVGAVSIRKLAKGSYYLGNLCIIPEFQHKGIGKNAIDFVLEHYADLEELNLVTPADKTQNIKFYTKKCGFKIVGSKMDGSVEVAEFLFRR